MFVCLLCSLTALVQINVFESLVPQSILNGCGYTSWVQSVGQHLANLCADGHECTIENVGCLFDRTATLSPEEKKFQSQVSGVVGKKVSVLPSLCVCVSVVLCVVFVMCLSLLLCSSFSIKHVCRSLPIAAPL